MKQYTSIGGQAVIDGVMMRSPNAFVVAVRKADGKIRLRRDQWFSITKKFTLFKKPFFRGVLVLIEAMVNGIVALNYSANIAMGEELRKEALKKGKTEEQFIKESKDREKVSLMTFLTVLTSLGLGMFLFVFVPHALTLLIGNLSNQNLDLNSFSFHLIDGTIKASIFVLYIFLIGLMPDIRKVFQYHGAEHKSIYTFEHKKELIVSNAEGFTTLHPRCGTSFIFFLLFISIILFSAIFSVIPIGKDYPFLLKHVSAVLFKIVLMLPIAGISYEIIRMSGKYPDNFIFKAFSFPGMMLQKLTTKNPTPDQLEVALASIKTVLFLEEKYSLESVKNKVFTQDEIDISSLDDIETTNKNLKDFLEL